MKLSAVSSAFVNYAIKDAISAIQRTGCAGVDIWGGRPHVYRGDYSKAQLQQLRKQLDDSQLQIASFMPAFYRYPHSLSSPNDVVRQDSLDYMRQCLDNAAILGADILLIVPSRSLHGQPAEDARQRLTDSIDTVCRAAAGYPVRLGIEPANPAVTDLVLTSEDALDIINTLGHTNLGVVLDTGHLNLTGERVEDAMARLGSSLLQFHVNDNDGNRQQNLIPGEGTFDFKHFVRLLDTIGYNGFLSIELGWDYTLDPVPAVTTAVTRMGDMLNGLAMSRTSGGRENDDLLAG